MGSATPAGSTGQIQYNNSSAFGGASQLYWDSGNAGLAYGKTTVDGSRIDVVTAEGTYPYQATMHGSNQSYGCFVSIRKARGSQGSETTVADGDPIGGISFRGYGSAYTTVAAIKATVSGTVSGNNIPTKLEFQTHNGTAFDTRMAITSDGKISTGGEAAPDCDPGGICINHGAGDGWAISLKNSDVNHPFTSLVEADTYLRASKTDPAAGGASFLGYGTNSVGIGLFLGGYTSVPVTGTSDGCVSIAAYKSDGGTGVADLSASENLCAFRSWATTKVIIKGSGDIQTVAGLKIGAYGQSAAAGAIEWNGTNFRGYNGSGWNLLDTGSVAGSAYQIQYNSGSGFGATADFYWELTNSRIWTVGDGKYAGHHAIVYDTGSGSYGAFATYRFGGTKSSPLAVSSGMFLGSFSMAGAYNSTSTASAWNFLGYASGTWSAGSTPSYLQLMGRNTSTNQYQIMRWDYAGNVAIGTHTSPAERLDLQDGSGNGAIRIGNSGGSNAGTIKYTSNTFSGYNGSTWVNLGAGGVPAGSDTQIQFNDGGSAFGAESTFTWNKTKDYLKVGTNGVFQFDGGGSYYYGIAVSHTASGNDHGGIGVEVAAGIPRLHMYRANGTVGTRTIAANTDYLGLVQFYGFDGTEYELGGGIRCVVEGTPATNNMPARLEFTTRPTSDTGPYVRLAISPTGKISTGGETAPDCDPGGICINHGANDGYPLTFKNSDVNHPFTSFCEADTYLRTNKTDSAAGGANIIGIGTSTLGISLLLGGMTSNPVSGTSDGAVCIVGYKSDGGTSMANLAATENLCAFRSWATTKVIIKGSGDIQTVAGLKIGAYGQTPTAGAIEWNGTNFRGYNGSSWVNF
jgi:hypothetical protein